MKPLLIVATGRCVWDDVKKVRPSLKEYDTLAINRMIMHWPEKLTYAASWHSEFLVNLLAVRSYRKRLNRPLTYAPKPCVAVDFAVNFYDYKIVTSGMYGVCVGCHLGYEKIILAGLPFDRSGHFYTSPHDKGPSNIFDYGEGKSTPSDSAASWNALQDKFGSKVRAVSGNLTKCFGGFTDEWLKS